MQPQVVYVDANGNPIPVQPQQVVVVMAGPPPGPVMMQQPQVVEQPAPAPAPAPVASPSTDSQPAVGMSVAAADPPAQEKKPYQKPWDDMKKRVGFYVEIALGIVVLILAIVGYAAWSEKIDDFNSVVRTWNMYPPTTFTVGTGSCAADQYTIGLQVKYNDTIGTGPGGSSGVIGEKTPLLNKWRGSNVICMNRDSRLGYATERLRKNPDGTCPGGYTGCPNDDVCYPSSAVATAANCPISGFTISGTSATESVSLGSGLFLTPSRGGRPIANAAFYQGLPCIGTDPDTSVISLDKVPCADTAAANKQSRDSDTRYLVTDSGISPSTFLSENGLSSYTSQAELTINWQLNYRPEILWTATCPRSRSDVSDMKSRVNTIGRAQLAMMIITIIVTIYNFYALATIYKQMRDDNPDNDDLMIYAKDRFNIFADVVILIPTLIATIIAYTSRRFFSDLVDQSCSDDITNRTFKFVADEAIKIGGINIAKLILTVLKTIKNSYDTYKARQQLVESNRLHLVECCPKSK